MTNGKELDLSTAVPVSVEQTRALQEVQGALVIAQKFPRNEMQCFQNILETCKRKRFAAQALYAYPRGGTIVRGPSIRMAELIKQKWRNIVSGVREMDQENGRSTFMAYAWDLETNTRVEKVFVVPHKRFTRQGTTTLTDPRDIYEAVANVAARRERACILALVPVDIIEDAVDQVNATLAADAAEGLPDRIKKMVKVFKEISVSVKMVEARLEHKVEDITAEEMVDLMAIYKSLRDNFKKRSDYFTVEGPVMDADTEQAASDLATDLAEGST